ncbi:ABC transporter ATP-binding protein [Nitriliruptor alkaliphilus]|uniref:ABC transporter ATP-binding protein n=1 Tax=Nitriliruptor alkaliphilus TaxID=427918 RepID=UPI000696AECA|nr:ABC transporter ATP-binding protein [Nitriliruptor alkaliphilus]
MLLEARDLDTYYGPSQVLHGCNIEIAEGECVAVLGRNGVGKTTLVHSLAGLIAVRGGSVHFDGKDITKAPPEKRLVAGVTLVPQGHRVFRSLTVTENLTVAERRSDAEGTWRIDDVYDRFPILRERAKQSAGNLSGGQQQMLAVARAMLGNGRVVLMDEPSEGLDPQRVTLIGDIITELKRRGTAVLLVEQRVAFALKVADRVAFMVRGEVVESLDGDVVRADPDLVTRHLGLVGA